MRRKIDECDRSALATGHSNVGRQILRDRVVERDFASSHHVGEEKRG
jgi:hypothetical protein